MAFLGFTITRQQDRYDYGFNQPTLNTREQDKWPYELIDKRKRTIPCFKQVLLLFSPTSFTVSLHESPHHWFNVTCKRNQPQSHMSHVLSKAPIKVSPLENCRTEVSRICNITSHSCCWWCWDLIRRAIEMTIQGRWRQMGDINWELWGEPFRSLFLGPTRSTMEYYSN